MQGRGGRWAPLGLLLTYLHLSGLSARSIGGVQEKVPQDLGTSSPLLGQPSLAGPSNLKPSQSNPVPEAGDLARAPLKPSTVPSERPQPGGPGLLRWPLPGWLPLVDSRPSEDPWQIMAAVEDHVGDHGEGHVAEVLTKDSSFPSSVAVLPLGDSPLPLGSLTQPAGPFRVASGLHQDSDPRWPSHSDVLGAQGEILAQQPPWFTINGIQQPPLPGFPWGTLTPSASWGGGVPGTGWGTKPMPHPVGIWGINNQYPSTSWGDTDQYPGTSWGNINRYPGTSWGSINRYPGTSWGSINRYPGTSWGSINRYPGTSWGSINRYPGTSWGVFIDTQVVIIIFLPEFSILLALLGKAQQAPILKTLGYSGVRRTSGEALS